MTIVVYGDFINNSGVTQKFVANQDESGNAFSTGITFKNSATAGSAISLSAFGGQVAYFGSGGVIHVTDTSSADHATIEVFGATTKCS